MTGETVWLDGINSIRRRPLRWQRTRLTLQVLLLLTIGLTAGVALAWLLELRGNLSS